MTVNTAQAIPVEAVSAVLRDELAHGDALIGTISPILRHLLANDEHSLFGDDIIARVRGMMSHVASQLLDQLSIASGNGENPEYDQARVAALVGGLVSHGGFLGHVHALALEWQLTERLQARLSLDPVLSPLLQALIASSEAAVASTAMALLTSLARHAQCQRRMQLPLGELPGDLLHAAILVMRANASMDDAGEGASQQAEKAIRGDYDEGRTRLGLTSRLLTGMGGGATAALSVSHAGTAMFLSALALASGQDRDMAILATNEGQLARLALALRSAGLKQQAVEEQFLSLHPDIALPPGFDQLGADQAAALLAHSAVYPGG